MKTVYYKKSDIDRTKDRANSIVVLVGKAQKVVKGQVGKRLLRLAKKEADMIVDELSY